MFLYEIFTNGKSYKIQERYISTRINGHQPMTFIPLYTSTIIIATELSRIYMQVIIIVMYSDTNSYIIM